MECLFKLMLFQSRHSFREKILVSGNGLEVKVLGSTDERPYFDPQQSCGVAKAIYNPNVVGQRQKCPWNALASQPNQ